ncbi:hypothetical protein WG954_07500 [Lacibacter sp. H375]|uniref:hypothetical protein n=1 Tax=Lacibacter sp. H375 TaxID=3133424 RepID=UPI0030C1EF9A
MDVIRETLLETIRKTVFKFQDGKKGRWYAQTNEYESKEVDCNDFLFSEIMKGDPLMISRLGTSELHTILNSLAREQSLVLKYKHYFRGSYPEFWVGNYVKEDIAQNSGFFPTDDQSLEKFVRLYLKALPNIDILLSWLTGEKILEEKGYLKQSRKNLFIYGCEPYFSEKPWTKALTGKKVLVIHPFEDSIRDQYQKRELLFGKEIMPAFELITLKAVQSIKGNHSGYQSWFEALEKMQEQINAVDFDIALIAAGSYGLPLAAHVKSLDKQGIHLGGFLQLFFGIRGKRWELSPHHSLLVNEHWKFPYEHEYPSNYQKLDHGSYW